MALAMSLAAFGASPARGQSATLETPQDATTLLVVTPEFPAGATAPPGGVRVDVSGLVRADGSFEPHAITAEGQPDAYVAAVTGVVRLWHFLPAVDRARCVPIDAPAKLAVWFEGSAAQPRIFVSQPSARLPADPPPYESVWDRKLSYTGTVEGRVKVLLLVSPEGRVKSAQVRSSEPRGFFDAAVLRAARRTLVTWKSPAPERDVCAQREYRMCLGSAVGITARHVACDATR